jgi:hypothetical protein
MFQHVLAVKAGQQHAVIARCAQAHGDADARQAFGGEDDPDGHRQADGGDAWVWAGV